MKKLPDIIFCLCILFMSVIFVRSQSATQTKPSATRPTGKVNSVPKKKTKVERFNKKPKDFCDLPPNVTSVELSQTEIILNCPTSVEFCSNNKVIKVMTIAVDPEGSVQKYFYTVSGGKVIGEGTNVEWDLSEVKPGTYTITAAIGTPAFDGNGWAVYGQTKTKVVVVKE